MTTAAEKECRFGYPADVRMVSQNRQQLNINDPNAYIPMERWKGLDKCIHALTDYPGHKDVREALDAALQERGLRNPSWKAGRGGHSLHPILAYHVCLNNPELASELPLLVKYFHNNGWELPDQGLRELEQASRVSPHTPVFERNEVADRLKEELKEKEKELKEQQLDFGRQIDVYKQQQAQDNASMVAINRAHLEMVKENHELVSEISDRVEEISKLTEENAVLRLELKESCDMVERLQQELQEEEERRLLELQRAGEVATKELQRFREHAERETAQKVADIEKALNDITEREVQKHAGQLASELVAVKGRLDESRDEIARLTEKLEETDAKLRDEMRDSAVMEMQLGWKADGYDKLSQEKEIIDKVYERVTTGVRTIKALGLGTASLTLTKQLMVEIATEFARVSRCCPHAVRGLPGYVHDMVEFRVTQIFARKWTRLVLACDRHRWSLEMARLYVTVTEPLGGGARISGHPTIPDGVLTLVDLATLE
eukprot:jgi/Mesvir1/7309/Mv19124-RA.1